MQAMVLTAAGQLLGLKQTPTPEPGASEVLVRVLSCGVCRTDLHIFDGDLPEPKLPLILGHEIVGAVEKLGEGVTGFAPGQRVGISWLGLTCRTCSFCLTGQENLCEQALFTGYQRDGGYADYTVADANYCFALPEEYTDAEAAPLLCAGLIGWRCLKLSNASKTLGLYGFGAAAHIICQVARHRGLNVYAFTRPFDLAAQKFALSLGCLWAGGAFDLPPQPLDAAIIFAPAGDLVPSALKAVRKGGTVVLGGIHMSDIPSFPYELLWGERAFRS